MIGVLLRIGLESASAVDDPRPRGDCGAVHYNNIYATPAGFGDAAAEKDCL